MTEQDQLPLPFQNRPDYDPADFVPASSNDAALRWLARDDWPDRRLALWGPEGCGKTHLLHIWTQRHAGTLLDGRTLADLSGLPDGGCLALDDADQVRDPELLLHLLNTARDRGLKLLLAARSAPARWPVSLPDLSSRLRAINAVEIDGPDDTLLQMLLVRALAVRQLDVAETARTWLLRHTPRTASGVQEAVRRLDMESLQQHKPITRAFAARVLGTPEADFSDDVSPREDSMSRPEHSPKLLDGL
ncbi:MAG TPA: chromosomal replication initiator DnaA [Rhodopila sp.]|uniref:chromosomal replication initiator DnaA n=1 Tax=Rhodopila sp. TaxID=2480087 RepID=UPI002B595781|nr:chromosomal replication initiator DnaA [Rhodopila sp.]HVY18108.1 chromosomal replication initiator DnaA [Rhodopila sp.]